MSGAVAFGFVYIIIRIAIRSLLSCGKRSTLVGLEHFFRCIFGHKLCDQQETSDRWEGGRY